MLPDVSQHLLARKGRTNDLPLLQALPPLAVRPACQTFRARGPPFCSYLQRPLHHLQGNLRCAHKLNRLSVLVPNVEIESAAGGCDFDSRSEECAFALAKTKCWDWRVSAFPSAVADYCHATVWRPDAVGAHL